MSNSLPFKIYLVGGAVRDQLLGIPVKDRDWVVVGATPEQMLAQGFEQVGKDFPVFLHPQTKEEYALARTERKKGIGYHGFEVHADPSVTLEEDLRRRDLTINAMAQDPETGEIIDPYGGQSDLKARLLRHVSPAFQEDPLRVLRVARFAAKLAPLGFQLAPETAELMTQMAHSGELNALTPERVWQEVVKAFETETPSVFFAVLRQVDALQVLFPEIDTLFQIPQSPKHHPEGDAGTHTLMVLDAAARLSSLIKVRYGALVHDLGKGLTPPELWPKHPGHEAKGVPLVEALGQRYRIPKETTQFAKLVTRWHGQIHRGMDLAKTNNFDALLEVLEQCQAYKKFEQFQQILTCCEADHLGRKGFENTPYPQKAFWEKLRNASESVDIQAIMRQGFKGKEIQDQIRKVRLEKIKETLPSLLDH